MQAARGVVGLRVELAAGVQHRHHDCERADALVFWVRPDGDAAAVVGDGQESIGRKLDLDPRRMSGDGLVHGVVDHLGEQVMHRLFVRAADIHAGAATDGLEAFEHFDVMLAVAAAFRRAFVRATIFRSFRCRIPKRGQSVIGPCAALNPAAAMTTPPEAKRRDARQRSR